MKIKCPHCGEEIVLEETLINEFKFEAENKMRSDFENEYSQKIREIKESAFKEAEEVRIISQRKSDEQHEFKQRQLEEKIKQMQLSLDDANRRAALGNNQQKGEALELKLEEDLKLAFPEDDILEIKKGKAGADIHHIVKNNQLDEVGIILYDTKNAKWQTKWIEKLKEDVRVSHAHIGILVSIEIPSDFEVIQMIDPYTFVVQQKYIMPFIHVLRMHLQSLNTMQSSSQIKDKKMAVLYKYLIGPEFRARIDSMVSGFDVLNKELDKEKRSTYTRWAHEEKAIGQLVSSTYSLYGDLQGLSGGKMSELSNSKDNLYELTVEDILNAEVDFPEA